VKECTSALLRFAKKTNIPILLVRIHRPKSDPLSILMFQISEHGFGLLKAGIAIN
jgi:hypothetical protein